MKRFSTGGGGSLPDHPELRAQKRKPKRVPRPFESFGHVHAPSAAIKRAIELSGMTVVTDQERDKLVELDEQYERIETFCNDHTRDTAELAYRSQGDSLRDRVRDGKVSEVQKEDAWTLADWTQDYAEKAQAARENLRLIVAEASPTTLKIRDRLIEACLKATDVIEEEEQARAAEFGMPHTPSSILIAIGRLSWTLSQWLPICPADGRTAPRPSEILRVIDGIAK